MKHRAESFRLLATETIKLTVRDISNWVALPQEVRAGEYSELGDLDRNKKRNYLSAIHFLRSAYFKEFCTSFTRLDPIGFREQVCQLFELKL